jgi:hypothetical protein
MAKCDWCGGYTSEPLGFDDFEEEFCSRRCFDQFITRGYRPTKKEGCFVATACYGDYEHPVVKDLRIFRDGFLKNKAWGNAFINWYYDKGPKYAKFIEKKIIIKMLIRSLIIRPIHITFGVFGYYKS